MTTPSISHPQLANDANNNSSPGQNKTTRRQKSDERIAQEEEERKFPRFVFDPDSALVCYWTAAVALVTLYNAWTIALRIAFPEMRVMNDQSYLPIIDVLCDLVYVLDIIMQLRTAYLQDGIPVFDPQKIRQNYISQTYFIQDVICVLPSHTLLSLLPDGFEFYKYFLCSAGAARLTKLLKFHILYKFYDLAESFTSNPHLIRVLRLFLNLTIIIHWIACLYYLLSEYEGLGTNDWVYTNATDQQRFSRKYLKCLYWSAMTLTTIGDTNTPETDLEYIFTGVIFLTGVFVFATVMGNVGDVISSMNANRQEFQARMDHIQMYLTHKKVPASLQLKIKKWAEYTWSRTKATDESRLLNMLPERLRAEVAVHVHLDSLKKVKIFEQCETGFLCELVLKLRSQVFSPGDYVCRVGETGREMFIINHGKVEVVVNNPATFKPMVVAVLSEGNYFGEISLLRLDGVQNRRTADVRSIGYSELLCLSRRDLMAALVEYPEAKSVLEDQAKKRMKTNLQAQRAFSVDTLLRSSQEQSSMDSGVVKDEIIGQDVSEIKAMIEELKNANKVPGRSVWQMIAKCEVLQAKLSEKEKEVEDSKNRIRDLETLLYSRHRPKLEEGEEMDAELLEEEEDRRPPSPRRNSTNVTRQYSQDEGRPSSFQCLIAKQVPDLKVTPSSEPSSGDEATSFIKTSKLTNIFERPCKDERKHRVSEVLVGDAKGSYEDNFDDAWNYTNETSIDQEFLFRDQQISVTTSFRDEFHLLDSLDLNVHTILEESEEECSDPEAADLGYKKPKQPCYSDIVADKGLPHTDSVTDRGGEDVIRRRYTNIETNLRDKDLKHNVTDKSLGNQPYNETDIGGEDMIRRRYTNIETNLKYKDLKHNVIDNSLGNQPYNETDIRGEDMIRRLYTNIETNLRDKKPYYSDIETAVADKGLGHQPYNETDIGGDRRLYTNIKTNIRDTKLRQPHYSDIEKGVADKGLKHWSDTDNETGGEDMIRRHYTNIENVDKDLGCRDLETKVRDKDLRHRCYTDIETDSGKGHRCYDNSLNVEARPLSFRNRGRVTSNGSSEAEVSGQRSSVGSLWKRRQELESGLDVACLTEESSLGSARDLPNNGLVARASSTTDISDSGSRSLRRRSASADGTNEGFNEIATLDGNTKSKDSGFRSMFDRLSSSNSVDKPDSRSMWKLSTSSNSDIDRPITPDENPKDKYSGFKYMCNKLSSTNGADKNTDAPTTSGDAPWCKSCPSDRSTTTFDEHTSSEVDGSSKIEKAQSRTQEIKRLLDGQASKSFKCVNGMDFLRMTSMRSLQSDNNSSSKSSRRSSWAYDSDEDKSEEGDYDSG